MKKILIQLVCLMSGLACFAQQEAMYTQYMENQIYVNPAYAGNKECLSGTVIHRQQWAGFQGAPMTTSLSLHAPTRYQSLALGADVLNDKIGPLNRLNANVNLSYRIRFSQGGKLCFGVKAGIDTYSGDLTMLDKTNADPLAINLNAATTPVFGAGAYYFSEKWFVGASVPRLTSNLSGRVGGLDDAKHLFAIAGFVVTLSDEFKLRPTTQLRVAEGAPLSLDASVAAIFNDRFWIGGMYRINESAGGFIQYQIADQFKLGYAIDLPLNGLRGLNVGSHEVLLSYTLKRTEKGLVSPRYF